MNDSAEQNHPLAIRSASKSYAMSCIITLLWAHSAGIVRAIQYGPVRLFVVSFSALDSACEHCVKLLNTFPEVRRELRKKGQELPETHLNTLSLGGPNERPSEMTTQLKKSARFSQSNHTIERKTSRL